MKRFHAVVVASAMMLALFAFGCDQQKKTEVVEQEPAPAPAPKLDISQIPNEPAPAAQPSASELSASELDSTEPITTIEPAPAASKSTKAKPKEKYSAPAKKSSGKIYTVKKGDTLQEISQKFYGTTKNWRKIYTANKSKIKNPNSLQIGTKLTIP